MPPSTRLPRTDINPELFFRGRPGDPRLGEFVSAADSLEKFAASEKKSVFAIVGCSDDTGVTLNRGRAGAKGGPDSIRKHLFKMVFPEALLNQCVILDLGNIISSRDILETHRSAEIISTAIADASATAIFLGGGHDFAAPNYLGFCAGLGLPKGGLLNIDPHLDVRELEKERPHSGTPFRQLLESQFLPPKNLIQFGARRSRNAASHFEYCEKKGVSIFQFEEIETDPIKNLKKGISKLKKSANWAGLTIDMDCCSESEGTSAAPVVGFTTRELLAMTKEAAREPIFRYLEIAEVAPNLDPQERSSRIAAEIIFTFLSSRLTHGSKPKSNPKKAK